MIKIPAAWMRGGTSKCWIFEWNNLQVPGKSVDEVLLRLFGSPENRQIDGVSGGTSTTSVRTLNTNTDQLILQKVPTLDGKIQDPGTQMIPGLPFPGMTVGTGFLNPAGKTTGKLFPTGEPVEKVTFDGREVSATFIDAGAPLVILDAESIGLTGNETPAEIDDQAAMLVHLDDVRRDAAVRMGLAVTWAEARRAIPKLALVARAARDDEADLNVRMLSMGRLHPALAITQEAWR